MRVMRSRHTAWLAAGTLSIFLLMCAPAWAQDILGGITGTVKDSSGAIVADADVKARNVATNQEIDQHTNGDGFYSLLNLAVGMYEVTMSKTGFQTETHTQVLVSGNRTATVDGNLRIATASTTVNVIESTPLMNQTDTTNGYVVDALTIQNTPLGTGSFTQLAILAPGVHADFLSSSGSNGGLGNQAIYSNGQRASSNSFSLNGVDTNNLFNGNSTSGVTQYRFVLNEGESFPAGGGIQTATSVYAAIGQALPTPPIEAVQEISVNAAIYDASQGAHSGAHIGVITKSGTNALHGELYEYFQNSPAMDAAPFLLQRVSRLHDSPRIRFKPATSLARRWADRLRKTNCSISSRTRGCAMRMRRIRRKRSPCRRDSPTIAAWRGSPICTTRPLEKRSPKTRSVR